ncbi:hypothetical protein EJ05DRAFT_487543 [Pseudovirgaria hyperparasitica]|uniref:Uncharacterized protein n=1 Tax=Pseudovirgaria hyperparasitica TaxID=470096 RepID=A0A6A6W185_9PEZI|nr:uncharacterized protein EJ05DRAFT_487543 [Pseudovirgaria hyperparasitica]KAF2756678.1 hypothetical protein EJ05DRAFT_487543 [Pseudovirgaria hyperparasitica]
MSLTFNIPTVTEDDLRQFGLVHFPSASLPESFFYEQWNDEYRYDDDDDGLGYYDDGVKRTLTDEQIAIFRSSEVKQILAKRQKNYERNKRRNANRVEQKRKAAEMLVAKHKDAASSHHDSIPSAESRETTDQLDAEQETSLQTETRTDNQLENSDEDISAGAAAVTPISTPSSYGRDADGQRSTNIFQKTVSKRLKRKQARQRHKHRREAETEEKAQRALDRAEPTPRRIARELDQTTESKIELDY